MSIGLGIELPNDAAAHRVVVLPRFHVAQDAVHLAALPGANTLTQVPAVPRVRATLTGEPGFVAIDTEMLRLGRPNHAFDSSQVGLPSRA